MAKASTRGVFLRDNTHPTPPARSHGQLDVSLITCVTTAYLTVAVSNSLSSGSISISDVRLGNTRVEEELIPNQPATLCYGVITEKHPTRKCMTDIQLLKV